MYLLHADYTPILCLLHADLIWIMSLIIIVRSNFGSSFDTWSPEMAGRKQLDLSALLAGKFQAVAEDDFPLKCGHCQAGFHRPCALQQHEKRGAGQGPAGC